jgi:hypothetical protein
LVRVNKRLLRCKTPPEPAEKPKEADPKDPVPPIPFDLPTFNIANPHVCLPSGASGYVP